MKSKKFKPSSYAIWDYDIEKMDFSDPDVLKWYLKRKIDYNDWSGIKYEHLKKYLPELEGIDPYKKEILEGFIEWRKKKSR